MLLTRFVLDFSGTIVDIQALSAHLAVSVDSAPATEFSWTPAETLSARVMNDLLDVVTPSPGDLAVLASLLGLLKQPI